MSDGCVRVAVDAGEEEGGGGAVGNISPGICEMQPELSPAEVGTS